jgi:predicted RNase H-like HicB family nuclease
VKKNSLTLTGIVKKEGNQYSALCLELDVASCGSTPSQALDGLRDAIQTYVKYMLEQGREKDLLRPVPVEALREFLMGVTTPKKQVLSAFRAVSFEYRYAA